MICWKRVILRLLFCMTLNDDRLVSTPKAVLIGLQTDTLMTSKEDVGLVSVATLVNVRPVQDVEGFDGYGSGGAWVFRSTLIE
ncbi:hypothetical protein V6N11_033935 [Hibiscus sabdariffa]|uniref:Uncharacterized protein n=1 Tax=Hibiscus sabdariffa TaxID=183260 RepID=A0ABR2S1E4_9ROSI